VASSFGGEMICHSSRDKNSRFFLSSRLELYFIQEKYNRKEIQVIIFAGGKIEKDFKC
jgi:hypothetical protein